jgi:hypothetical protein
MDFRFGGTNERLRSMAAVTFIPVNPSVEDCWRGIILYGQNSASYKFALAESLLQLNPQAGQLVKLEDLAPVFGKAIAGHISHSPKQGTRPGKFLQSVENYNTDGNLDALVKSASRPTNSSRIRSPRTLRS